MRMVNVSYMLHRVASFWCLLQRGGLKFKTEFEVKAFEVDSVKFEEVKRHLPGLV